MLLTISFEAEGGESKKKIHIFILHLIIAFCLSIQYL
jgi:hypothetical protein